MANVAITTCRQQIATHTRRTKIKCTRRGRSQITASCHVAECQWAIIRQHNVVPSDAYCLAKGIGRITQCDVTATSINIRGSTNDQRTCLCHCTCSRCGQRACHCIRTKRRRTCIGRQVSFRTAHHQSTCRCQTRTSCIRQHCCQRCAAIVDLNVRTRCCHRAAQCVTTIS